MSYKIVITKVETITVKKNLIVEETPQLGKNGEFDRYNPSKKYAIIDVEETKETNILTQEVEVLNFNSVIKAINGITS